MGALVTLDLAAESPLGAMPWIITFGPLSDEEEWEPVVCGPYERPHALALAGSVVADVDLMAVVEPLLPHVSVDHIRADIAAAQRAEAAEVEAAQLAEDEDDLAGALDDVADEDLEDGEDDEGPGGDEAGARMAPTIPPAPSEIRAGFARISSRLVGER